MQRIDGEKVLESVLEKVNNRLDQKKRALKKLVDEAEMKFSEFFKSNKSLLSLDDVSFFNVKARKNSDQMTFSPDFLQPVGFHESAVHIPLDIYDGCKYPN